MTPPGLSHINYTQLMEGKMSTIDCTPAGSPYTQNSSEERDIAILHVGSYNAANFLSLSVDLLPVGARVDVIGYPGELKSEWMMTQTGIRDVDQSLDAVAKLLPKRTLTISRGTVKSSGPVVAYELSTCPGMSGSCVLYNGNVIGIDFIKTLFMNRCPHWPAENCRKLTVGSFIHWVRCRRFVATEKDFDHPRHITLTLSFSRSSFAVISIIDLYRCLEFVCIVFTLGVLFYL
jgi:hypothetical protein